MKVEKKPVINLELDKEDVTVLLDILYSVNGLSLNEKEEFYDSLVEELENFEDFAETLSKKK